MALSAGDADCTVGLSARIYNNAVADARSGFVSPLTGAPRDSLRALCYAIARAVVSEITENALVVTTVTVFNSGLQRNPEDNVDCLAPSVPKTLNGAVT